MEATSSILTAILAVFAQVGSWVTTTIPQFYQLFYNAETGLTLLGVLAVSGLGMSVIFLLIGIIQRFIKWQA